MGLLDYIWGDTEDQKEARLAATPFKTKHRRCTDLGCLFLYLTSLLGWIAVAVVGFMEGDPQKILYPTDSAGNVCGVGAHAGKPMMFMFDITRCAGIGKALEGCPTPSICVHHCPDLDWSYKEGKLEEVRQFCYGMTDRQWETETMEKLVQMRICPAYLVKQKPLFDRCLPSFVNGNGDNVTTSSLFSEIEDGRPLVNSVHDGLHSNYTFNFSQESDLITSINGFVKKLIITDNENTTTDRKKRTVDVDELNTDIFFNEDAQTEYNEVDFNMTDFAYNVDNTTKRDLTDVFDLDTLREGVEQLKKILDLKTLSERLLWDLSLYWWILLLFLFLAFVLSFLWIGELTSPDIRH